MSSRKTLGIVLSIAILAALALVTILNPTSGAIAILFAVLAASVTRLLFSSQRQSRNAVDSSENNASDTSSKSKSKETRATEPVSLSALLDATMNSMREGVLIVDSETRIVASNTAANDTFQNPDGRLENLRLSDLTRNPPIHEAFRAALDKGEPAEVKVEMRRGLRRTFDLRVAPLRFGRTGQARGAIGVFYDITQLERLERVRQEFLSNVSHELRTPLTAIIAFVETLEDGAIEDPEHNRRFLKVIRRNAERMHNLIDDILELSSIEAGIVTVESRPVRLTAVVDDILTALAARAEMNKVTLRNEVPGEVMVYADGRRLEQMLTNLVDNAVKFSREGSEVSVRHTATDARDSISVTDAGEGISAEHIERIFERFYRVDRARSRDMGGTGLGLAIVKHLARAHGGEATVHSTPGEGSTFSIELPRQVMSDEGSS